MFRVGLRDYTANQKVNHVYSLIDQRKYKDAVKAIDLIITPATASKDKKSKSKDAKQIAPAIPDAEALKILKVLSLTKLNRSDEAMELLKSLRSTGLKTLKGYLIWNFVVVSSLKLTLPYTGDIISEAHEWIQSIAASSEDEETQRECFLSHIRFGEWQKAQAVVMKCYAKTKSPRYLECAVFTSLMDPQANMMLADRMLSQCQPVKSEKYDPVAVRDLFRWDVLKASVLQRTDPQKCVDFLLGDKINELFMREDLKIIGAQVLMHKPIFKNDSVNGSKETNSTEAASSVSVVRADACERGDVVVGDIVRDKAIELLRPLDSAKKLQTAIEWGYKYEEKDFDGEDRVCNVIREDPICARRERRNNMFLKTLAKVVASGNSREKSSFSYTDLATLLSFPENFFEVRAFMVKYADLKSYLSENFDQLWEGFVMQKTTNVRTEVECMIRKSISDDGIPADSVEKKLKSVVEQVQLNVIRLAVVFFPSKVVANADNLIRPLVEQASNVTKDSLLFLYGFLKSEELVRAKERDDTEGDAIPCSSDDATTQKELLDLCSYLTKTESTVENEVRRIQTLSMLIYCLAGYKQKVLDLWQNSDIKNILYSCRLTAVVLYFLFFEAGDIELTRTLSQRISQWHGGHHTETQELLSSIFFGGSDYSRAQELLYHGQRMQCSVSLVLAQISTLYVKLHENITTVEPFNVGFTKPSTASDGYSGASSGGSPSDAGALGASSGGSSSSTSIPFIRSGPWADNLNSGMLREVMLENTNENGLPGSDLLPLISSFESYFQRNPGQGFVSKTNENKHRSSIANGRSSLSAILRPELSSQMEKWQDDASILYCAALKDKEVLRNIITKSCDSAFGRNVILAMFDEKYVEACELLQRFDLHMKVFGKSEPKVEGEGNAGTNPNEKGNPAERCFTWRWYWNSLFWTKVIIALAQECPRTKNRKSDLGLFRAELKTKLSFLSETFYMLADMCDTKVKSIALNGQVGEDGLENESTSVEEDLNKQKKEGWTELAHSYRRRAKQIKDLGFKS